MSVDIFEVSTNYASDPVFMNLNDIAKHFIHALTKSIEVVVGDLSKMNANINEHMTGGKLYNLLTTSSGFDFKSGINLEKIATVALWKGPPTPPKIIIAKDGICNA